MPALAKACDGLDTHRVQHICASPDLLHRCSQPNRRSRLQDDLSRPDHATHHSHRYGNPAYEAARNPV